MEFFGWISSIRNTELEIQNHDNRARQLKKGIQSLVGSEFRGVCPWGLLIGSFSGVLQWGLLVGSAIAGPLFYIKKTEEMTSLPDFPIMMFLHYTS